ncbi:hypothetical protein D3C73_1369760 [compost metagenome]
MGDIGLLRLEGKDHLHQNRGHDQRKKPEPDRFFRFLAPEFLVEQITGQIQADIHRVAERHDDAEHLHRLDDLNVGYDRSHADPGIKTLFSEQLVTKQKKRKVDEHIKYAPSDVEQTEFLLVLITRDGYEPRP